MKTWHKLVRAFGIIIMLSGLTVRAQAQFNYSTYNGAVTITGYTGTNASVTIPDTISGLPVTGIGGFYARNAVTNVNIPASVTNIAEGALAGQPQLLSITVEAQNEYYSSSNGILFSKDQSSLIQAPGGMIGSYIIPDGVTNIASEAFFFCSDLTNITIGSNVLNIGSEALADCLTLNSISVDEQNPSYSSSNGVLFDKSQATLIQAPGGIAGSYVIPSRVTSVGAEAFITCGSLTSVTVPDSVTNIGDWAFASCNNLTNVTMGANVTSLGDYVFFECFHLASAAIPSGLKSVGTGLFEYCYDLGAVNLTTNVTNIGAQAFESCSSLGELVVPDSVTNIGSLAFDSCVSLTNVVLGTNVGTIGDYALEYCYDLGSITIPASVTHIGNSVFSDCVNLTAIEVDGQNPAYCSSNGVLLNKSQSVLIQVPEGFDGAYALPDSVTNINVNAFTGCAHLTAILAGAQNEYFTAVNGVLFDKPQTTLIQFPPTLGGSYTVPNGVVRLDNTAFYDCSNLISVAIPASVTNVGPATFAYCSHLGIYFAGNAPTVTWPGSGGLTALPPLVPYIFDYGYYSPDSEAVYYLPGTTGWGQIFDSIPAYLWTPPFVCTASSNSIAISGYNGAGGALVIPDMINGLPVTAIGNGAFDNAAGVEFTNIILNAGLRSIGDDAFAACVNLTSIIIPAGVTNVGGGAFNFCDNLKSVYFQGNAPVAPYNVFFEWTTFPIISFYNPIYEPPTPTTVYYLPGTTGWGATFAGQPAVPWNPEIQAIKANPGMGANGFGFNIAGTSNLTVMVEACTNLYGASWQPLQTITLTDTSTYFSDPQSTNYPERFYRLGLP